MAYKSGVAPEDWMIGVIVPLYEGKGEITKCKNCTGIGLPSVVGKIYAEILLDRVRRVTGDFIDDEQGGFRVGKWCVGQIFTLKQIGERAREKKRRVYVGLIYLGKAYDRDNR